MLLQLTHTTELDYTDLISESVMELRMAPRQEQDQHRLSFTLAIGPPTAAHTYFDWLGNSVHWFTINSFHREIRIVATSVVETDRPLPPIDRFRDTWPFKANHGGQSMYDYLAFGGPIVESPALNELAGQLEAREGQSLGEVGLATMHLIADRFTYTTGITTAASPIDDILATGAGVCQDFTHLMIGVARRLGIPARYVSGLLHPDADRFRGFTQTHAWCELFFPSAGWIGFDPTNNCMVGSNFVKVAYGRDYRDVPPNKGQYKGKGVFEHIDVAVHSEILTAIPGRLAADRVQSLPIPSYPEGKIAEREQGSQQQEQQQQQSSLQLNN